jgi:hypothetical protein
MKYEVIDNFLDKEYFDELVALLVEKEIGNGNSILPWYFRPNITYLKDLKKPPTNSNLFYMTHTFYEYFKPTSNFYENIIPILAKLKVNGLIRVKGNFYPNTETLHEHQMHDDYDYSHSGAILSLNTCDGYTKLKDGTKIDSVANRILLFDSSEEHCSTTTTNVPARINLNINYM